MSKIYKSKNDTNFKSVSIPFVNGLLDITISFRDRATTKDGKFADNTIALGSILINKTVADGTPPNDEQMILIINNTSLMISNEGNYFISFPDRENKKWKEGDDKDTKFYNIARVISKGLLEQLVKVWVSNVELPTKKVSAKKEVKEDATPNHSLAF